VSADVIRTMSSRLCILALALVLAPSAALAQDEVVYYHTDAIGSVRMVTDATGAVVARYDYLPFGETWLTNPPNTAPDVRQFAGKEREADTGLDYFGARYYRPQSGRFTSVDPVLDLEKATRDPQQWNRYAYARNNSLRYVDPDGRTVESLWDVFNIGLGIKSFVDNFRGGNIRSAAIDAGGIVIDVGAAAIPMIPGGAAAAIKAARAATRVEESTQAALRVIGHATDNYAEIGRVFKTVTPRNHIRSGSSLEREVNYLLERGYKWNESGTELIRF
jgi:RHS repeat-associated protein